MKHRTIRTRALLTGTLALSLTAVAQQATATHRPHTSVDVAATFNFERAQVAQVNGNGFWLKGGSVDASLTLVRGLGIAANFTGEHASNIQNNVSLGKLSFMAGTRYTFDASHYTDRLLKKRRAEVFAEALFGGVHAFDSVFPGSTGVATTAGAFSMQLGGGADIALARGFGIRALEVDYVHTTLPNNGANSQNDFRLAFGVSYRFAGR